MYIYIYIYRRGLADWKSQQVSDWQQVWRIKVSRNMTGDVRKVLLLSVEETTWRPRRRPEPSVKP